MRGTPRCHAASRHVDSMRRLHIIRVSLNVGWADLSSPFFLAESFSGSAPFSEFEPKRRMANASWQASIERTVTGLGFDLVDVERSARGLLRVFIDRIPGRDYPEAQGAGEFVTVDDCEVVTRQLLYVLEVDGVEYERLEVSSPGLDRPLKRAADFERFAGQAIDVTLKQAFQGRKHWKGVLQPSGTQWSVLLDANNGEKAGSELVFSLDEVREARLVPVIDFKRGRAAPKPGRPTQAEERSQGA